MNCEYSVGSSNKDRIPEIKQTIEGYQKLLKAIEDLIKEKELTIPKFNIDDELKTDLITKVIDMIKKHEIYTNIDELKRLHKMYTERLEKEEYYLRNAYEHIKNLLL